MVGLSITWIKYVHDLVHAWKLVHLKTSGFNPFLSALGFDIFAGVFTLVDVALATAASTLPSIPWVVCTAVDVFCALFLVAGGLVRSALLPRTHHSPSMLTILPTTGYNRDPQEGSH